MMSLWYLKAISNMNEENINLKDYIQVLIRRKTIIFLVFIVFLPFIVIQAFSQKIEPLYMASSKLLIEKASAPTLLTGEGFRYDPGFLITQTQIIKSSRVAEEVVRKLNLDETFSQYFPAADTNSSFIQSVKFRFQEYTRLVLQLAGLSQAPPQYADEGQRSEAEIREQKIRSLAEMISGAITVQPLAAEGYAQGNIVEVGFVSPNPFFAEKIVNNVASAYQRFLLEMRMASTSETIEWMKGQAEAQREHLEASEKTLQEYKKKHDLYTVGDKDILLPEKISSLSQRLTAAQAEVIELESQYQELNRIAPQKALNLPVIADNLIIRDLRKKIIDKEQEIEGLSKQIGQKHPRMIQAARDLDSLKEMLNGEIQTVIQSINNKYELAKEKEGSIFRLLNDAKLEASSISDKMFDFEMLNRDVAVHRLLYDRLISRIKEYDATDSKATIDVWVVEKARTPGIPINSHKPMRTIFLGLAVSLMAGVGLAFFLEQMDNTIKTAEDAEARTEVPVLGMVPFVQDKEMEIQKIVHHSPLSIVSERYKAIRTAVLLSSSGSQPQSILIASMVQKAGKTVTAVNLAIALAQSGRRVILIDADMRRPQLHKVFGADNKEGLSSYLSGESGLSIFNTEESTYLHILTSGPVPPNPSELLSSKRLEELLRQLRADYDLIVFDSPPMIDVTDSILIGKLVDQTILIARSGVSTYESLKQADKMLKSINAKILGMVVNAVDEKKQKYYYYKYYGSYGEGYSDEKANPPA